MKLNDIYICKHGWGKWTVNVYGQAITQFCTTKKAAEDLKKHWERYGVTRLWEVDRVCINKDIKNS